jgi:CRISPR-associated protein (TIGR03984 family)
MKREIINTMATCASIAMDSFADDPAKWLSQQMQAYKMKYLLAHSDDGVIWGRMIDGEELITSHDVAPEKSPPLRTETIQTIRIFAHDGELFVWRDEVGKWVGRLIAEPEQSDSAEWTEAIDEQQILLGTKTEPLERSFTLLCEGSQGLCHVVPLLLDSKQIDEQRRPLRLVVRHYLKEDDNGFVRVNASRLLDLLLEPKESNA